MIINENIKTKRKEEKEVKATKKNVVGLMKGERKILTFSKFNK